VRAFLVCAFLGLSGCGPGLVFDSTQEMSDEEMLARASHILIGVIQKQEIEWRPFFRLRMPGDDPATAKYWKILRREVRIEMLIRGVESRKVVDVYEIFWTGGASGPWNSTQNGERALFLVRVENGRRSGTRAERLEDSQARTGTRPPPHSKRPRPGLSRAT
jgi:hypothetical protein